MRRYSFVTQIRAGSVGLVNVLISQHGYVDSCAIAETDGEFETPTVRIFKDSPCVFNQFSSSTCVNGTKGCQATHEGSFVAQVKLQNLTAKNSRCRVDLYIVEA